MMVINVPMLFAASWRIMKTWFNPCSVAKVEVIAIRGAAGEKQLLELINANQLQNLSQINRTPTEIMYRLIYSSIK